MIRFIFLSLLSATIFAQNSTNYLTSSNTFKTFTNRFVGTPGQSPLVSSNGVIITTNSVLYRPGYFTNGPTLFVADGDSMGIFGYSTATNYPLARLFALYAPTNWIYGTNASVSGATLDDLVSRYTTHIYPFRPQGVTNTVLIVWAGINDFTTGDTASATFTVWSNYVSTARTDGFKVLYVVTNPRIDTIDAREFERYKFNRMVRDSGLVEWIYNIDLDLFPPPQTTIYSDNVHLNDTSGLWVAYGLNQTLKSGLFNQYPITAQNFFHYYSRRGDGSFTIPSYSFQSETNLGFYRSIATQVTFASAGSPRFNFQPTQIQPVTHNAYNFGSTNLWWTNSFVNNSYVTNVVYGDSTGPIDTFGSGVPAASLPNGSTYRRTDGTGPNFYVRENGAWVAK